MNTNMKELDLNEMEQVNGAGLFDWLKEKTMDAIDRFMDEYRKLAPKT